MTEREEIAILKDRITALEKLLGLVDRTEEENKRLWTEAMAAARKGDWSKLKEFKAQGRKIPEELLKRSA